LIKRLFSRIKKTNTESSVQKGSIEVRGVNYNYSLTRKNISRLYLRVDKNGDLNLNAPLKMPMQFIIEFVLEKREWIENQRIKVQNSQIRKIEKEQRDETRLLYLGESYPIQLFVDSQNITKLTKNAYEVHVSDYDIDIKAIVADWLVKRGKAELPQMLTARFEEFNYILKSTMPNIRIKKMKSRWGSYSKRTHTVNLSSELMKAPKEMIDYVIVHELCHIKHFNHSSKFYELMDKLLPDHRIIEKRLDNFHKEIQ
jgi:predicted metal-dependent hydrolase